MRIVLASNNSHKLEEISAILPFDLLPQGELNIPSAEETGLTFVENAILKARHACRESGMPAIADDSGLEVSALNGQPGIYSSRYAGMAASDSANNNKPRHNLVRYHGVLAPNARLRPHVVPATKRRKKTKKHNPDRQSPGTSPAIASLHEIPTAPLTWAQRLKRVFQIEITRCPKCGGKLRVISDITDPVVINKILNHTARAPPSHPPTSI